ncbi:nol1 nop2 sun domain containing protein [Grosmannia clavigera kw1407]|uniref:Nol1 nop2 sun domain containing protein n=1 Tax=Grosmannia clavigera (strain kw1407 / UAMH 11150) TaxID=655863 RepID=F0XQJ5_GROCL|nr:nol1 nop2 sun domain containing protein [Grosmannia clavigera kw1407]EFX00368.1 nol1 nop2 sun domain containing protein [Grosmannia clavigera kw1407]
MSLYHEAAAALMAPAADGGNLKTRIFGPRSGPDPRKAAEKGRSSLASTATSASGATKPAAKAPPAQVYALAIETTKWSAVLSEIVDAAGLLVLERRRLPSPVMALLLVHDLLLSRSGVRLPAEHGLHAAVARHKARLTAELTRARLRRHAASLDDLRRQVEQVAARASRTHAGAPATRWIRINTLKTTLAVQLATTFADYRRVASLPELWEDDDSTSNTTSDNNARIFIDDNVPDLVAVPVSTSSAASPTVDPTRSDAYRSGAIIFQDKASCFPAYLLDPASVFDDDQDVDLVDACAAPGNKTSHLAALTRPLLLERPRPCIFAFEKDPRRAKTLQSMLQTAGALDLTTIGAAQDFLQVDPAAALYRNVRALLLDPSCSGSGIVGRDTMPVLHLPKGGTEKTAGQQLKTNKKRKRPAGRQPDDKTAKHDFAKTADTIVAAAENAVTESETESARLTALAAFQLTLLLHAFRFPAARRITYSTCSVHAQENEQVVVRALTSASARFGWRLLRRDEQVAGMRAWPVRGDPAAAQNVDGVDDSTINSVAVADACIRSYPDDIERGIMGFFVAAFVRDDEAAAVAATNDSDSDWSGFDD